VAAMCGETAALTTIRGGLRCPSAQLKTLKRIYRTRELSPGNLSLIADSNAGTPCDPPSNNQTNSRIWWPYKNSLVSPVSRTVILSVVDVLSASAGPYNRDFWRLRVRSPREIFRKEWYHPLFVLGINPPVEGFRNVMAASEIRYGSDIYNRRLINTNLTSPERSRSSRCGPLLLPSLVLSSV